MIIPFSDATVIRIVKLDFGGRQPFYVSLYKCGVAIKRGNTTTDNLTPEQKWRRGHVLNKMFAEVLGVIFLLSAVARPCFNACHVRSSADWRLCKSLQGRLEVSLVGREWLGLTEAVSVFENLRTCEVFWSHLVKQNPDKVDRAVVEVCDASSYVSVVAKNSQCP
jgi:hypothetical protein